MLRTTHTSTVTEDQIDHLGHMNVRFYGVNAHAGTGTVLAGLAGWGGPHEVHDTYTRHHREQLLGTDLVVRSGVLGATRFGVRIHHELAAADSGALAATFVHVVSPLGEDGQRAVLPDELVTIAEAAAVPLPDYAETRTISLDHDLVAGAPSLAVVEERALAMRKERLVTAEECDAHGRYRLDLAPMLTWGGEFLDGDEPDLVHTTSEGVTMGWAVMETRIQVGKLPMVGTRIQSFSATVALGDKVTHQLLLTYDLDDAQLLTAFEVVNMAFDIGGRRAMRIPDGYRERSLARLQADLLPGPGAGDG